MGGFDTLQVNGLIQNLEQSVQREITQIREAAAAGDQDAAAAAEERIQKLEQGWQQTQTQLQQGSKERDDVAARPAHTRFRAPLCAVLC